MVSMQYKKFVMACLVSLIILVPMASAVPSFNIVKMGGRNIAGETYFTINIPGGTNITYNTPTWNYIVTATANRTNPTTDDSRTSYSAFLNLWRDGTGVAYKQFPAKGDSVVSVSYKQFKGTMTHTFTANVTTKAFAGTTLCPGLVFSSQATPTNITFT